MTRVIAPASSANLGAGFDALGLALRRAFTVELDAPETAAAPETHPAVRAFRAAEGTGAIAVGSDFPPGRGLGFSGAARVAGVVAAAVQRGVAWRAHRGELFALAAQLEGHADNAAASMYGGLVVTAGGRLVQVPTAVDAVVVLWIPERETSTKQSRTALPTAVPFADAAFNIGRAALLVAAMTAGDAESLRTATEDRLHQDRRLAASPESLRALHTALDHGAYGAWLSGSGPTIAALCAPDRAAAVAAALPAQGGRADTVAIDGEGVRVA